MEMTDIRGMRVILTGSNRGIGLAIAQELVKYGAIVGVLNRTPILADAHIKNLVSEYKVDIKDEESIYEALQDFGSAFDGIDCVISNAALMPSAISICDLSKDILVETMETNLYGSFFLTKYAIPYLIKNKTGGRIIYISSALGISPNAGLFPYSSSKAGIEILNKIVHKEYYASGVRTIAIAPGLTDTQGMRASVSKDYIEKISSTYPDGLGEPEDIIPYILFLCSTQSWKMSGTTIYIRPPAAS